MINSDPAGDCNNLWPQCSIKAARAWTCPHPKVYHYHAALCCAVQKCFRKSGFSQTKTERKHSHSLFRRWVWTGSNVKLINSWVSVLSHYSPVSKTASGKVQEWSNTSQDKPEFVPIRWTVNFRLGIEHTWLVTFFIQSHFSHFKLFLVAEMIGRSISFYEKSSNTTVVI